MRLEPARATLAAFILVLLAACSMKPTSPAASSRPAAEPATPSAAAPTPEPKPAEPVARAQPAPPPSTPTVTEKSAAKTEAPVVVEKMAQSEAPEVRPATKAVPPAVQQAPRKEAAPPAKETPQAAKPKEPPLDLGSLETRLKETKAIGIMTKISLKNQVDDLLNQFRAFYAGKLKTTLAELRRPYDLLVLKVLSLLQDADPSLAAAIVASREAIWGILSDPVKFADFASK